MARAVKLNQLHPLLAEFDYPLTRREASRGCDDVTLVLADGEIRLRELVESSSDERFDSLDELEAEVYTLLPRRAVGEPYQSEGDA